MKSTFQKIKSLFQKPTFDSGKYWEKRYAAGGNSGSGSYGHLAEFKARILNDFVQKEGISKVVEFGCGDGNQLSMYKFPFYIGLDVSPTIVKVCAGKFDSDTTKSFFLYDGKTFFDNAGIFRCDLSISIDVIYHLVEASVYERYLIHAFEASTKYVIIYSSNENKTSLDTNHEKYRVFTNDVKRLCPNWELLYTVKNEFRSEDWKDEEGSIADFFIFKRKR